MEDRQSKKMSIRDELKQASPDELSYILGRYCGPHNVLLAEKKYGEVAKHLQRLVNEEMASRQLDEFLLSDTE